MGFLMEEQATIYHNEFDEPDRCEECYEKWLESDHGVAYLKRVAEVEEEVRIYFWYCTLHFFVFSLCRACACVG